MSDETNETSEQQPVDETTEDQTLETAGPVAEGAPSSSQATGEDTSSAPPADEAVEPVDEAPLEEESAAAPPAEEAAPAAEEAAAEPEPAAEQPAAEAEAP